MENCYKIEAALFTVATGNPTNGKSCTFNLRETLRGYLWPVDSRRILLDCPNPRLMTGRLPPIEAEIPRDFLRCLTGILLIPYRHEYSQHILLPNPCLFVIHYHIPAHSTLWNPVIETAFYILCHQSSFGNWFRASIFKLVILKMLILRTNETIIPLLRFIFSPNYSWP